MRIIIINQSNFIQIKFNFSVNWRQHLRPILVIFASTVVVTIYVSSDITLLGVMENDYTVGIYTVVVKLCHIVQGVLAEILTVVIPRLAWLWGKKDA
ncbi:oligosaccharide flippase family protein [Lactobacillus crispatus]|uniref:oligosaccharide flippase family protein n=1 Tax=Lactobacillus crispatus TaxID=47770 RepID=UPI0018E3C5B5|nr:oligosaccharide flippase family protein [Lactobacillus crispatus]MBI1696358.1 polysaccharide biosynthesis protein [Lactobacillus crispatus]